MPNNHQSTCSLPLEEAATIRGGYSPRRLDVDPFKRYFGLQARDLAGPAEVQWSRVLRPRVDADPARYQVRDGDLVVLLRGNTPRAWRVTAPPEPTIVVGQLSILRVRESIADPDYLRWYLNLTPTLARLQALAKGSNMPFVPLSEFRRFQIALPTLAMQRAIGRAHALSQSEQRLQHQIIELRRQLTDTQLLRVVEPR